MDYSTVGFSLFVVSLTSASAMSNPYCITGVVFVKLEVLFNL